MFYLKNLDRQQFNDKMTDAELVDEATRINLIINQTHNKPLKILQGDDKDGNDKQLHLPKPIATKQD